MINKTEINQNALVWLESKLHMFFNSFLLIVKLTKPLPTGFYKIDLIFVSFVLNVLLLPVFFYFT
jgi:hypothetical protein